MAVFVEFEDGKEPPHCLSRTIHAVTAACEPPTDVMNHPSQDAADESAVEAFPTALSCYPVALSLASQLDLTDLYALALTCRSIRRSLRQHSHQLVSHSLRCVHDEEPLLMDVLVGIYQSINTGTDTRGPAVQPHTSTIPVLSTNHAQMAAAIHQWPQSGQSLSASLPNSSKLRKCARDLVAPCRKCGTIICRNCTAKPPSQSTIKERHRRLCRACIAAPIFAHLKPLTQTADTHDGPPLSSASSTRSARSISSSSNSSSPAILDEVDPPIDDTFTSVAFQRDPCTCVSRGVFLCLPCGNNLRAVDTTYKRVWTWRSRYSTHIGGGLGTGLGAGNQGQKCGRGESCLETGANAICWMEIDCSKGTTQDHNREQDLFANSRTGTPVGDRSSSSDLSNKPGYLSQEMEGIGGVVKKKVKKRVKVGATVWEYEDERDSGRYLEREASERERSWCGWCDRICLGEQDKLNAANAGLRDQQRS